LALGRNEFLHRCRVYHKGGRRSALYGLVSSCQESFLIVARAERSQGEEPVMMSLGVSDSNRGRRTFGTWPGNVIQREKPSRFLGARVHDGQEHHAARKRIATNERKRCVMESQGRGWGRLTPMERVTATKVALSNMRGSAIWHVVARLSRARGI